MSPSKLSLCPIIASIIFAGIAFRSFFSIDRGKTLVEEPSLSFTQITGLPWPTAASIVSTGDTHGRFQGDGELHIVFDIDRETLEKWLAGPSPWGQSEWKRGPVPPEIGYHCSFGSQGVAMVSIDDGPYQYAGDPKLERVLDSTENWYAVRERGSGTIRWHNGNLLMIDMKENRVWLSAWDF